MTSDSHLLKPVANAILFQVGWLIAVQGVNTVAITAAASLLAIHWLYFSRRLGEWCLIVLVAGAGYLVDSVLVASGFFQLEGYALLAPPWLLAIWVMFATTLCHALGWLRERLLLAAVLGTVAPPLSYLAGEHLSPIEFGDPLLTLIVLALLWAVMLPLFCWGARHV